MRQRAERIIAPDGAALASTLPIPRWHGFAAGLLPLRCDTADAAPDRGVVSARIRYQRINLMTHVAP
jgi:hypothetical protein